MRLLACPCLGNSISTGARSWFGADHRYCRVKGGDGALYILRLDENRYEWSLTMFASQEAQAIAAHSGAGMHPYPARQPN